jgi:hypothetical protein
MDINEKKRLLVTALAAQQIYAQCHDEAISLGLFKHKVKMISNNLIKVLETELKNTYSALGNIEGGTPYLSVVNEMDRVMSNLATLPIEYWRAIDIMITRTKLEISKDENEEGDNVSHPDGVLESERTSAEPGDANSQAERGQDEGNNQNGH